ncbi:MAG: hypothetical protein K2N44_06685 [Lachnospiraceae bacterium]|nr:hypothetical protein [Lachnospiraceae bacterium]
MFRLGKLEFEVESATVWATYMEPKVNQRAGSMKAEETFDWAIDIFMKEGDFVCELSEEELEELDEDEEPFYESVSPRLYHNNGFVLNISSWKELEGQTLVWESEYNANDEEAGFLYVFEHEAVTKGKIEFLERRGNVFLVRWSGTANVYWNDEYGEDVPFAFEGEVRFTGIRACSDVELTEEEVRTAMHKYINMNEFECESQDSHKIIGGKSYRWKYVPVEYGTAHKEL